MDTVLVKRFLVCFVMQGNKSYFFVLFQKSLHFFTFCQPQAQLANTVAMGTVLVTILG